MSSWHSYPSIYALGHKAIKDLFADPVIVEEKVDGSQFSFGIIDGELRIKSKGSEIIPDAPPKMFSRAVAGVIDRRGILRPDVTYRAEVLDKPKHNCLTYARVPKDHLIIFDINTGEEEYLMPVYKLEEATRIGYECTPLLSEVAYQSWDALKPLLDRESCLGGAKIEGFVVKNYSRFGKDKKALMGKYVSEAFKEVHKKASYGKVQKADLITTLVEALRTEARWQKAVQHMREAGTLTNSPKDIGALIKEVQMDIHLEETEFIQEMAFKAVFADVIRGVIRGLPEWYKEKLAEAQFDKFTE